MHKTGVVSSRRKRRTQVVFDQCPILVGETFHPGRSHECCPSAPQGIYYHVDNMYLQGSKGLKLPRVRSTPTHFPAKILYTPVDITPLHYRQCIVSRKICWLVRPRDGCITRSTKVVRKGPENGFCIPAKVTDRITNAEQSSPLNF